MRRPAYADTELIEHKNCQYHGQYRNKTGSEGYSQRSFHIPQYQTVK